jgi:predicted Zn-dependent protease
MYFQFKYIFLNTIIILSFLFSSENADIKNEQKILFDKHKKQISSLKKDYLLKKDNLQKEYDRLLPLYNSLNKEYNLILDSLDNIISKTITNNDNNDNPQMSKFFQFIENTKNEQSTKLKKRKTYYKNEFSNIDSTIEFLFDIILLYEKHALDNNNPISSLDAEIVALNKIIKNAEKTILNYESGVSSNRLNYSISSLINADRYINEKKYIDAINECKIAINNFPDNSIAYEKLGSAYYLNNNLSDALKNWTIALSMDPDNLNLSKFLNDIKEDN